MAPLMYLFCSSSFHLPPNARVEWVPIAICSRVKSEKSSISHPSFARSGIYFTWNNKDTPKGYNYYSTDRINLAFGPLQAAVNQCHFVKPQFTEDLLQHVDEVHANNRQLVTETEVVKEKETVVGVDMRYKPFRIPEIKDGRSHDNPDEFDETVGKDLKQQVLTDRIRNGMFRGATLLFFVIEPIAEKTLQAVSSSLHRDLLRKASKWQ